MSTDIERRRTSSSLEPARVRAMFERIARPYDAMNRIMTAGLDRRWRALAADEARVGLGASVIDVCCGTGELTLALAERVGSAGEVIGVDFSPGMLSVAQRKMAERGLGQVQLITADALELPFPAGRFAAATVAFGMRNLADHEQGFRELRRVVRPGGRVVCLEITTPTAGVWARFYRVWFDRMVPIIGRVVDHGHDAYSYLPASVRRFPGPDDLGQVMLRAGLRRVRYRILAGGIIAVHTGEAT